MLIDKGANVNAADRDDNSALILAAKHGPESVIRLLIDNGADVNAVGLNGTRAIITCAYNGKKNLSHISNFIIIHITLCFNITFNIIQFKGFATSVQALIENGAEINATDDNGNSALLMACLTGEILTISAKNAYKSIKICKMRKYPTFIVSDRTGKSDKTSD